MQMPKETQEKLKRYLINADPFLWGVLKANNKKGRIKELQDMGFLKGYVGGNPIYTKIIQDLLLELGVEGILEHIVAKRVEEIFPPEVLQYFRRYWEMGQLLPLDFLRKKGLYKNHPLTSQEVFEGMGNPRIAGYREPAFIFFDIDVAHFFVEHWTTFAGLWFEEIEPLLGSDSGTAPKS